ncbi:hypothetical protein R0J90_14835, partial [Micrococcus sp. SIMBA_144]
MNVSLLSKKANKHKKLWENQVILNPYSYRVKNIDYYLVIYQRGETFKGYSVVSENEYSEKDAKVAFEALIIFTVFG